jgi:RNA polymerase sigma-70 factor (ECF subfamily)
MIDAVALGAILRGSESALGQLIDKYTAYVCVIVRNVVGDSLTHEDVEETASDVFFALWQNADKVEKLKSWLGATARNKAINKLREVHTDLPIDDEIATDTINEIEEAILVEYERRAVKDAIMAMDERDREIFLRYYYDSQTVAKIVYETGMTEAAVRKRLTRGKRKLRSILDKQEVFGL